MSVPSIIRAVHETDFSLLERLRNDHELQLQLLARPTPNTPASVREWVQRRSTDGAFFVIAPDNTAVGFIQLTQLDHVSGHAQLGLALDAAHRGQGHGRAALEAIATYGRDVWNLRKLCLEVLSTNPAQRLYERVGFQVCGTRKAHFYASGAFRDVTLMEWFL